MCGIAGIIDDKGEIPDIHVLSRMGEVMAYRGPDDHGTYANLGVGLTHRRLSVIDLTSAGHQPMANSDETIWLVFNGEIYNYIELTHELKREGYLFKSTSDTEVIIHSYEEWGTDCVNHFNGMFAFALWDKTTKKFFAARDRLGIKPFYYWFNGHQFIFASEIKAILCHPLVLTNPNLKAVQQYLLYSHSIDDNTWYNDIRELLPGHYIDLGDGCLKINKYWDLAYNINYERTYESFSEELHFLIEDAVSLNLRSDVPVGAHLSGGIDSSSIVAIASKKIERLHTFSASYPDYKDFDEGAFINIVSDKFRTVHHAITPRYDDVETLLSRLIWYLDEPVIGPAILPMYRICESINKNGVKVVNGGQGADELFGGYPPFFALAAKELLNGINSNKTIGPLSEYIRIPLYLLKGGSFARLVNRFRRNENIQWIRGLNGIRSKLVEESIVISRQYNNLKPFELYSVLSIKNYLRGLLHQEDRMSMVWSIESRVPLCDYRIAELASTMPSWMKINKGVSKSIMRDSLKGITPPEILNRKDKKGYPVPIGKWFGKELKNYVYNTLINAKLISEDIIDKQAIVQMFTAHVRGTHDYSSSLWLALNTELWFRGIISNWKSLCF